MRHRTDLRGPSVSHRARVTGGTPEDNMDPRQGRSHPGQESLRLDSAPDTGGRMNSSAHDINQLYTLLTSHADLFE